VAQVRQEQSKTDRPDAPRDGVDGRSQQEQPRVGSGHECDESVRVHEHGDGRDHHDDQDHVQQDTRPPRPDTTHHSNVARRGV
jgi:hypothetical protein